MKNDSLGDRMKRNYENINRNKLCRRTPVIIRLDGKAFHTLTKSRVKPFDMHFLDVMTDAAETLFDLIGGNLKFAYVQSDEVSLLLTDWDKLTTEAYFDYNIQKLCSVVASTMSVNFSYAWPDQAVFDARCFNIPKEEVCNYFVWRQQDWMRNSLQMLAQSYFTSKELHGKNSSDMHSMLEKKQVDWNALSKRLKNGTCLYRAERSTIVQESHLDKPILKNMVIKDLNTPIFTKDRQYIEGLFL